METQKPICTDECLRTCTVLSKLGKAGLDLDQAAGIVDAARTAAHLPHSVCGNGEPVTVQKGREEPWQRCDLPPDVQHAVGGVAAALEAGLVQPAIPAN